MARIQVTTNLTKAEYNRFKNQCSHEGCSEYALARKAIIQYVKENVDSTRLEKGRESDHRPSTQGPPAATVQWPPFIANPDGQRASDTP